MGAIAEAVPERCQRLCLHPTAEHVRTRTTGLFRQAALANTITLWLSGFGSHRALALANCQPIGTIGIIAAYGLLTLVV